MDTRTTEEIEAAKESIESRRDKIGRVPMFEAVAPKYGIPRKERREFKRKMEKEKKLMDARAKIEQEEEAAFLKPSDKSLLQIVEESNERQLKQKHAI